MTLALAFALTLTGFDLGAPPQAPSVLVELDPCVELDPSALERQLALEFGPTIELEVREADEQPSGARATQLSELRVACGTQGLSLTLDDQLTNKSMARELGLTPGGGEWERRALALAIVEFVRASWLELELRDEPEPAPAERSTPVEHSAPASEPPVSAASPATARAARRRASLPPQPWLLSLGPRVELLASELSLAGGGQLRVVHRARRNLAWTLGAGALHARTRSAPGRLAMTEAWLAPALLASMQRRHYGLAGGAGVRVGFTHLRGRAADDAPFTGRAFVRSVGGAFALTRAQLELPARRRLALALELELGWIFRPVTALSGTEELFSREGLWVALAVELAFGL